MKTIIAIALATATCLMTACGPKTTAIEEVPVQQAEVQPVYKLAEREMSETKRTTKKFMADMTYEQRIMIALVLVETNANSEKINGAMESVTEMASMRLLAQELRSGSRGERLRRLPSPSVNSGVELIGPETEGTPMDPDEYEYLYGNPGYLTPGDPDPSPLDGPQ